jgi:hypothetical protein
MILSQNLVMRHAYGLSDDKWLSVCREVSLSVWTAQRTSN